MHPGVTRDVSRSNPAALVTSRSLLRVVRTSTWRAFSRWATRLPVYPQPRIRTEGTGKLLPAYLTVQTWREAAAGGICETKPSFGAPGFRSSAYISRRYYRDTRRCARCPSRGLAVGLLPVRFFRRRRGGFGEKRAIQDSKGGSQFDGGRAVRICQNVSNCVERPLCGLRPFLRQGRDSTVTVR
jgi:hypothetical protein